MRTETQMYDLILNFARREDHIRVVVLNGSRVNSNMPKDIFQDYDVACYVDDLTPYLRNLEIIRYFGDTIIYQLPDEIGEPAGQRNTCYAYLMQFTDGNRIDLTFCLLSELDAALAGDSLAKVLLDKDNLFAEVSLPSDRSYLPLPPTEQQYDHCCNEFWWLMPYVAKGLWRGEIIGPKYFLDEVLHGELKKMLTWYYGVQTNFSQSPGKMGRFFEQQFDHDLWGMIKNCYSDADAGNVWESIYTMGEVFRIVAQHVAHHFGFNYPHQDDARVTEFLRKIQAMPTNASSFYP